MVLETTWTCAGGQLVVQDALALGKHDRGHGLGQNSPGVLLRHARCTVGEVEVVVEWAPRPEFGLVHPQLRAVPGGVLSHGGATVLVLSTGVPLVVSTATARGTVVLGEWQELALAVEQADAWEEPPAPWTERQVRRRIADTCETWRSWSDLHQRYSGPLQRVVHRSGMVLIGLMHVRTGALLAAATTSLPEGEGTGRTWDYRFTWVRDASMTLRGLHVAACPEEAQHFFAFIARAAATQLDRGHHLQIMFGIGGERDLSERELPQLSGWRGSGPVRVGNGAWNQHQQDVYGALLDAAHVLRDRLGDLEDHTRALLVASVEAAAAGWQQPDQGIWEVRGPARRYTHSTLMCWVALDRGIALADLLGAGDRVERWTAVREEIRAAILTQGWNEDVGAFTQSFGSRTLDAATLLVGLVGLVPGDDRRFGATIDAVQAELTDERGLVVRYRGDDGLEGEEGSFLLCTFWLAEALAVAGRLEEAETVLRRAAGYANDLGLLAEEVDGVTGQLLGNYPQAFSHLGLVLAAQALATAQGLAEPGEMVNARARADARDG